MLSLPDVTLIAVTGRDLKAHKEAIKHSCKEIEFGDVVIINRYSQTIDDWNKAIVYDLCRYVSTDFALLIHADGYVIHPELWNPDWLKYDYIGAPWPLPTDDYSYRTPEGKLVRVGNSVSLRSKKMMELPTTLGLEWKPYFGNTNEDGFLCVHNRETLEKNGCKFAPLEVAVHFSKEHEIPENIGLKTFAFHKYDPRR